jgi:adenine-specific DNA-methyltransferase
VELKYEGKAKAGEITRPTPGTSLAYVSGKQGASSRLILGENIRVMQCLLRDHDMAGKAGLVYIDPPFATEKVYRMGKDRANTVSAGADDAVAYDDTLQGADYLEFIRRRLVLVRELMSDRGSIYLHIDCKVGHYIKVIMDEIFGAENFRNDIARVKCSPKNFSRKAYGNIRDMVLFYTKTGEYTWNEARVPFGAGDIERLFKKRDMEGRKYTTVPLHAPGETRDGATGGEWRGIMPPRGRHWRSDPRDLDRMDKEGLIEWSPRGVPRKKIFAESGEKAGKKMQDVWEFKDMMYPDYPTQKNREMLDMIVRTSSNEGDLVLDCFCGSGTTLVAAREAGRAFTGIDNSRQAVKVAQARLSGEGGSLFGDDGEYEFMVLKEGKQKKSNRQ